MRVRQLSFNQALAKLGIEPTATAVTCSGSMDAYDMLIDAFSMSVEIVRTAMEVGDQDVLRVVCPTSLIISEARNTYKVFDRTTMRATIGDMAKSAAKAAIATAKAAISGEAVTVPADVEASRQAVCAACEHWDGEKARCKQCGCFTNFKIKLATQSCPLGKWLEWRDTP